MKRLTYNAVTALLLVYTILFSTFAFAKPDEGMYMPDQISKLAIATKGSKIKASDIYDSNGGGLSEAIVKVNIGTGGHGTGEFVSPDGLILTNHHVGFDALVAKSTPAKNLGEDGFTAKSRSEEIEAVDYSITITQRSEDVTKQILDPVDTTLLGKERQDAIAKNIQNLEAKERATAPNGSEIRIQSLNSGFFYYLFQTLTIKDIRVVYAPPKNVGAFGGDDDNFEWTRHCADFTFLRAYVAPDGKPASYSPKNVPFKPRKSLAISLNGVRDGEFNMVLGYPGGTTRYRESQYLNYSQTANFPFLVDWLTTWNNTLVQIGQIDSEKKVKLQSEIASLMNSMKLYSGGIKAMHRADIVSKKQEDEAKFETWANATTANEDRKQKYGSVISDFKTIYADFDKTSKRDTLLRRMMPASATIFTSLAQIVRASQSATQMSDSDKKQVKAALEENFKNRDAVLEREMIKFFLRSASQLPANQRIEAVDKLFGKDGFQAHELFAKSIADGGTFDSADKIFKLYSMSFEEIRALNPQVIDFVSSLNKEKSLTTLRLQKFNEEADKLRLVLLQGMSEMKNKKPYPDANATLRFGFGNVKGYKPREATTYTPFTTLKGILEKDTGREPFNAPEKLLELQKTKDFGRYGQGDSVPVNFLSTVDIIGGNSGSPVLNSFGDQIGVVFDGNYEGLGNDMFVSQDFGRTIIVDIRYVLFITEKLGNAGWIFQEMNIKGGKAVK
jgi:F0F1-type ATP synthase delta subunit